MACVATPASWKVRSSWPVVAESEWLNDVMGLIDLTSGSSTYGQMVVQYQYDAYSNTLSTTAPLGVTTLGERLLQPLPVSSTTTRSGLMVH